MKTYWLAIVLAASAVRAIRPDDGSNVWIDILSCVEGLANSTAPLGQIYNETNDTSAETEYIKGDFSMMKLFSIICGDKNGFVQCLDSSLKNSSDSMTQLFGSFFDPAMVTQAYEGLCTNITEIEQGGTDALSCLSKVTIASCQNEMADYFFYMGVVKKFAPPSEQLSLKTMETLLCSVTFQRRRCEVQLLRQCSPNLANVMEQFYTQTQPALCAHLEANDVADNDNRIE